MKFEKTLDAQPYPFYCSQQPMRVGFKTEGALRTLAFLALSTRISAGLIAALLVTSCSSTRYATDRDEATAKQFVTTKGKASVYVYRAGGEGGFIELCMGHAFRQRNVMYRPVGASGGFVETTRNPSVRLADGTIATPFCRLSPGTFTRFDLEAGRHEFIALVNGKNGPYGLPLHIVVEKDTIYYFALSEGPKLFRALDLEGKTAIQKCRMVFSALPRQK